MNDNEEHDGDGGSSRTAMQVIVEISKDLLQSFSVAEWNAFVEELSAHGLIPTIWAPGEKPPPLGIMLDFRGLRRGHYRLTGIDLSLCSLEGASFEVFHDEVGNLIGLAEAVNLHDIGMTEPGHGAGFKHEPGSQRRVVPVKRFQRLDGDLAPQPLVNGEKYLPHAAGSDLTQNAMTR